MVRLTAQTGDGEYFRVSSFSLREKMARLLCAFPRSVTGSAIRVSGWRNVLARGEAMGGGRGAVMVSAFLSYRPPPEIE